MNWIPVILALIIAYLLGSMPFSVWVGRLFFGRDVRKEGSGNAGTTNTIRVLGWKAGAPVLVLDVLKGWAAVSIIYLLPEGTVPGEYFYYLAVLLALAAVTGHIFPLFAGFRGGKGVASLLGIGLALYPVSALLALGLFVLVFLLSGYVSLSSLLSCMAFPILAFLTGENSPLPLMLLSLAVALFVPLTHLGNIKRLIAGRESRVIYRGKKR